MKIDMMRKIDRGAGIPLCFLFSVFNKIQQLITRQNLKKTPEKILFIEMSEMGSVVLAYSLFKKTKNMYPDAELFFLTFKDTRFAVDILHLFPEKNVISIDSRSFLSFFTSSLKAILRLRKEHIDLALDMELFARYTTLLCYLIGAKSRVGFDRYTLEGLYRGNLLTHRVIFNPHIHISQNLLNLIDAFASLRKEIPLPKKPIHERNIIIPKATLTKKARQNILNKLFSENPDIKSAHKIILINPNAGDIIPIRRWPPQNYIELVRLLLKQENLFVILTGTEPEKKQTEAISQEVGSDRCISFAGKTTFPELIDLYQISDILITNDSGPVHFSAMTDIQTFVFFGPETPKLYGPLTKKCHVFYANFSCSPCVSAFNHRKSPCDDNKCLQAISVGHVYETIKKFLY